VTKRQKQDNHRPHGTVNRAGKKSSRSFNKAWLCL